MAQNQKPSGRKPATKFSHLQKKMDQNKLRADVKKINTRRGKNK